MPSFREVLKNYGDFAPSYAYNPQVSQISYAGNSGVGVGRELTENAAAYDNTFGERRVGAPQNERARRLYESRLHAFAKHLKRALDGDAYARLDISEGFKGRGRLVETMSISDFPNLFGDVIDRAVTAAYAETPYTWSMIAKEDIVNDFRLVKRFRIDYGTAALDGPLEPGTQYPERYLSDKADTASTYGASAGTGGAGYWAYNVQKYGDRMPFFWETLVNDDLNAIKDTPARFGRAARRREEKFVTTLFANNTNFFSNSLFKNTVVATGPYTATNPPLSMTALAQAMTIMANQRDKDGEPIEIEAVTLVVGPALKVTAQNILNADYFWANDQGGTTLPSGSGATANATSGQRLNVANWARNIVRLAVNYYLPVVDATYGQTGWYLFANPSNGRPAIFFGHLRGYTTPQLFMKMPNSINISEGNFGPGPGIGIPGAGAMSNPMEGDFDTDSIHYKIRHILGGTLADPIMAVYSNGSGS